MGATNWASRSNNTMLVERHAPVLFHKGFAGSYRHSLAAKRGKDNQRMDLGEDMPFLTPSLLLTTASHVVGAGSEQRKRHDAAKKNSTGGAF
jgi:hypothetical protein